MSALSGAAVVGTVGGLAGALIGLGIPEFEARKFEANAKTVSCFISIHSEDSQEVERAKEICELGGAKDILVEREYAILDSRKCENTALA